MFHRTALTAAVALLAAAPAFAGGFTPVVVTPPPATPVVPVTPVIVTNDWSGAYVGGQLGFGRLSTDAAYEADGEFIDEEFREGEGAVFGVHAGYMVDLGRLVAGAELDYDRAQIGFFPIADETETDVGEITSIGRAKLRVGFDAGRVLPYVTAGIARASVDFYDEGLDEIFEDTTEGTFVGLGASFMASDRLMVSIEGLRHNFDGPALNEEGEEQFEADFETVIDTVTLRGSFRF